MFEPELFEDFEDEFEDDLSADFHQYCVIPARCDQFRQSLEQMDSEQIFYAALILFQENQELQWQLETAKQKADVFVKECKELQMEVERFQSLYDQVVSGK